MSMLFSLKPRPYLLVVMILSSTLIGIKIQTAKDLIHNGVSVGAPSFGVSPVLAAAQPEADPKKEHPPVETATKAPEKAQEKDGPSPRGERDRSDSEMELISKLSVRREQLEKRAKELDLRESLIRVTEQRVDQKIKEMETLKAQLQSLLNQASAAQQTQIDNLIKIYETMKPKEAARIFETLDLPILMGVVQRMKPQKIALIMAEMPPERAKEITIAMTKQDQLPQIKGP